VFRLSCVLVLAHSDVCCSLRVNTNALSIAVSDFLHLNLPNLSASKRFPLAVGCWPLPWSDGSAQPRVAHLRRSLLNMHHIFNKSARSCAGADEPRFVPAEMAPPDYCIHSSPHCEGMNELRGVHPTAQPVGYDEYANERIFLARHLQTASAVCDPARAAACRADIVVVPSLFLHLYTRFGFTWAIQRDVPRRMSMDFWVAVRQLYFDGRARPPLIVVHYETTPDGSPAYSFFGALSDQPVAFQSAVLVTTRLSTLKMAMRTKFDGAWSDDALAELRRRESLVSTGVPVTSFGGPLLVSVPAAVGVSRAVSSWRAEAGVYSPGRISHRRDIAILAAASILRNGGRTADGLRNQYVRLKLMRTLRRFGANCTAGQSLCARCVRMDGACLLEAAPPRSTLFSLLLRAHMCMEPPGDTLERSHIYAAIQSGCVPVIVDGGHRQYDESQPTAWPWRRLMPSAAPTHPGDPRVVPPTEEAAGGDTATLDGLDYTRFAIVLNASTFGPRDEPFRANHKWHKLLISLVGSPRLTALRTELERVAPLFAYALDDTTCAADAAARLAAGWHPPVGVGTAEQGPPCDAFDVYRRLLARAWRVHAARIRQTDSDAA